MGYARTLDASGHLQGRQLKMMAKNLALLVKNVNSKGKKENLCFTS
jgi:hypothetical protein